jgi:hypothetical protein
MPLPSAWHFDHRTSQVNDHAGAARRLKIIMVTA